MEIVKCTHCNEDNKTNAKYCRYCGYELPKPEPKEEDPREEVKSKRKISKQKVIGAVVGTVVFFLVYFAIQHFIFGSFFIDKVLMKTASELNKSCPVMVDAETRFDNAAAMPGKTFQYNYTLINMVKDSVDIASFSEYLTPQLVNNIKTNPDMEFYRNKEITLAYKYVDKNGVFITKIDVTPTQYQE